MANNCYYSMTVAGRKSDVKALIEQLQFKALPYIGRVFECYESSELETIELPGCGSFIKINLGGDCAWSVSSSMLRGGTLIDASIMRNLLIEIFSEESGIGFCEHYVLCQGVVLVAEEVELHTYSVFDELLDEYITNTLFGGDSSKAMSARATIEFIGSREYKDAVAKFTDEYNSTAAEDILKSYNALTGYTLSLDSDDAVFDDSHCYLTVGGFSSWDETYSLEQAFKDNKFVPDKYSFSENLYMKRRS